MVDHGLFVSNKSNDYIGVKRLSATKESNDALFEQIKTKFKLFKEDYTKYSSNCDIYNSTISGLKYISLFSNDYFNIYMDIVGKLYSSNEELLENEYLTIIDKLDNGHKKMNLAVKQYIGTIGFMADK